MNHSTVRRRSRKPAAASGTSPTATAPRRAASHWSPSSPTTGFGLPPENASPPPPETANARKRTPTRPVAGPGACSLRLRFRAARTPQSAALVPIATPTGIAPPLESRAPAPSPANPMTPAASRSARTRLTSTAANAIAIATPTPTWMLAPSHHCTWSIHDAGPRSERVHSRSTAPPRPLVTRPQAAIDQPLRATRANRSRTTTAEPR